MKIGVSANIGTLGHRLPGIAKLIEELGFESVWTGEHIFVPVDVANPLHNGVPLPDMFRRMPDLFVTLSAVAAVTQRLVIGTNVCLLPQRHPLTLAKEVATLDQLSQGRFILGIGNGWIAEEAEIMGFTFKDRVKRTNEFVQALKLLWTKDKAEFAGDHVRFPPVYSYPKPWQKPHPPILVGAGDGTTVNDRILRRVVATANGWLPTNVTPRQMAEHLGRLKELCDETGRDFSGLDITVLVFSTEFGIGTEDAGLPPSVYGDDAGRLIDEYAQAGVNRVVVVPWNLLAEEQLSVATLERLAGALGL